MTSGLPLVFIIGAILALGFTGNLFSASPFVIAFQLLAVALNLWARASFTKGTFRVSAAPEGTAIIRRGPYRFVRHPMYAAALLLVWASVAGHLSLFTVSVGAVVTIVGVARVLAEERLLRAHYPDYESYARTTKALVPFLF